MFDHALASHGPGEGRGWGSLGMAAGGHLALLAGLLCSSYLIIEQVTDPSPPIVGVIPLAPPITPTPAPVAAEAAGRAARGGAVLPKLGTPRAHASPAPVLPAVPLADMLASSIDPAPPEDATVGESGSGEVGVPNGSPDGSPVYRGVDPKGGPGGGDGGPLLLVSGIEPPVLVSKVLPEYPERARLMRLSGRVFVQAVISPRGDVANVQVISSSLPVFEDAARRAVSQWKYRPATLRGQPVAVYFTVVVSFTLQ